MIFNHLFILDSNPLIFLLNFQLPNLKNLNYLFLHLIHKNDRFYYFMPNFWLILFKLTFIHLNLFYYQLIIFIYFHLYSLKFHLTKFWHYQMIFNLLYHILLLLLMIFNKKHSPMLYISLIQQYPNIKQKHFYHLFYNLLS